MPRIVAATAAAVAFYLGTLTFFSFFQNDVGELRIHLALCSGLLAVALPLVALRPIRRGAAIGLCIAVSPVVAIVNSMLDSAITVALDGSAPETAGGVLGLMMMAVFCSGFLSIPLWVIGAGIVSILIGLVHPLVRDAAREVPDVALKRSGLWLAGAAVPALGLILVMPAFENPGARPITPPLVTVGVVICAGLLTFVTGELRLRRLRRWVERVRAGSVPGWKVVPRAELPGDLSHVPPLYRGGADGASVLVRKARATAGGAYRSEPRDEPWAIV